MYGPVATSWLPYVDGESRSYLAAYSRGTGAVSGMTSAPARTRPVPRLSLKTIVESSGVSIPAIGSYAPGTAGAPTMSPKYAWAYPLGTLRVNPRSIAYLTSALVTSRFTGGEKWTP